MRSELIAGISTGLLAMVVLAGCATSPHLDSKFGEAVNKAKAEQTINPDASRNTDPVAGVDGQAAKGIIDRYHKAYESPSAAPSGAIGSVTGGGTTLK